MKKGFSLVEVLIVVSILSVFFIVAISVLLVSLRNMKTNEHKIYATHYARQLEDWLRTQKTINWGGTPTSCGGGGQVDSDCGFTGKLDSYCFNSSDLSWPASSACSGDPLSLEPAIYNRDLVLSGACPDNVCSQVDATITVSWKELGKDNFVETKTVFSVLE